MKKAIAIALSVCMIFAISACGNKQENGETDDTSRCGIDNVSAVSIY